MNQTWRLKTRALLKIHPGSRRNPVKIPGGAPALCTELSFDDPREVPDHTSLQGFFWRVGSAPRGPKPESQVAIYPRETMRILSGTTLMFLCRFLDAGDASPARGQAAKPRALLIGAMRGQETMRTPAAHMWATWLVP